MDFGEEGNFKLTALLAIAVLLFFATAIAEDLNLPADSQNPTPETILDNNTPPQEQPAIVIPENPLQDSNNEIIEDTNQQAEVLPVTPAPEPETPVQELQLGIISPLGGQKISGAGIIILEVLPKESAISASFEISGLQGIIPKENNFSTDFNSTLLQDGNFVLKISACSIDKCVSKDLNVEVSNPLPETPAQTEQSNAQVFASVEAQGSFSAISIQQPGDGNIVASGTGSVGFLPGNYNALVEFRDFAVKSASFQNAVLDSNKVLINAKVEDFNALVSEDGNFTTLETITINENLDFANGIITFNVPSGSDALFKCSAWNYTGQKCDSIFEKESSAAGAFADANLSKGMQAFAFVKENPKPVEQLDVNSFIEDQNSVVEKKAGKRIARLEHAGQQKTFFTLTDENGTAIDENVTAFLEDSHGKRTKIDYSKITRGIDGKISISGITPRSFKAGSFSLQVMDENSGELLATDSFELGLLAVNSPKGIYRPGEEATLEIVVLDKESYGVKGAQVKLAVQNPAGETIAFLSTEDGSIIETSNPGVYYTKVQAGTEEGEYQILAEAKAQGIDTKAQTSFQVLKEFAFDIKRNSATKIDPAVQPNNVKIEIQSFGSEKKITVREPVPSEFTITPVEGEIKEFKIIEGISEGEKIIEWKNIEFDSEGKAVVEYAYSVPDIKPWLYTVGPLEVYSGNNEPFIEARDWMIAVDANPTSKLFFRRTADLDSPEPEPNDANCGTGCGISGYVGAIRQDINSMSDVAGAAASTRLIATGTTKGMLKNFSFVSPPMTKQTIVSAAQTWIFGMACFLSSVTGNTSRPAFAAYRWQHSDGNGERIVPFTYASLACPATTATMRTARATVSGGWSFQRGDKLVVEVDANINNAGGAITTRNLTFSFNGAATQTDSNLTLPSGISLTFAGSVMARVGAPANNSTQSLNTPFNIDVNGWCTYYNCGDTNSNLQYCKNPSTSCNNRWMDLNTDATKPLFISAGSFSRGEDGMIAGDLNNFRFQVTGGIAGDYSIRAKIDSTTSEDTNYSTSTGDINLTIASAAADSSFAIAYPSTGCTAGKGNITGGTNCQKGYFETTDLTGLADETQVNPEGQTASIPFMIFDNQSTTSTDLNIALDVNEVLPASLKVKASTVSTGWEATCSGNTTTGCIEVSTTDQNVGTAVYGIGTKDLNVYLWADFVSADVGQVDKNLGSTSAPA